MTEIQIKLVKESWAKVVPISETAASLFYGKLFELDPELKPLFKSDIKEQGKKLMQMINTAVGSLDRLGDIVDAVKSMGARHRPIAKSLCGKDEDKNCTNLKFWAISIDQSHSSASQPGKLLLGGAAFGYRLLPG